MNVIFLLDIKPRTAIVLVLPPLNLSIHDVFRRIRQLIKSQTLKSLVISQNQKEIVDGRERLPLSVIGKGDVDVLFGVLLRISISHLTLCRIKRFEHSLDLLL